MITHMLPYVIKLDGAFRLLIQSARQRALFVLIMCKFSSFIPHYVVLLNSISSFYIHLVYSAM